MVSWFFLSFCPETDVKIASWRCFPKSINFLALFDCTILGLFDWTKLAVIGGRPDVGSKRSLASEAVEAAALSETDETGVVDVCDSDGATAHGVAVDAGQDSVMLPAEMKQQRKIQTQSQEWKPPLWRGYQ